jgi:hypothetical protein
MGDASHSCHPNVTVADLISCSKCNEVTLPYESNKMGKS